MEEHRMSQSQRTWESTIARDDPQRMARIARERRERDLGPALADALSSALGLAEATNARGVASKIRGVMGGVR